MIALLYKEGKVMKKNKTQEFAPSVERINKVKPVTNIILNIFFTIVAFVSIFPFVLVLIISVSSEASIAEVGYSLVPTSLSSAAYEFIWNEKDMVFKALGISIFVTVVGTVLGVAITTMLGYALSNPNYKLKKFFTWVIFIPMIFNGGLVASYVINTTVLDIENTLLVLILPLLVSSFNVVICKTFFKSTIPESIVESAKIDGATQFRIFASIVVPISKPLFATIALFLTFGYWNDWFLSSLYIVNTDLYSLQALLNVMMKNIQFFANNPTVGVSLTQYASNMPSESVRMAIAVVIILPIACAYPFFQKYFISGLTIGAVKG